MKYLLSCWLLVLVLSGSAAAQSLSKPSQKILLIPLDDRPPCLQFTQKMGLLANAEVVAPPMDILGNFMDPGQPEKISKWLDQQDLTSFDGAIISFDMVGFGGLVASRIHDVSLEVALKRLDMVSKIRKKAPKMRIYGQSVIMRLAPTGDGKNDAYRDKLADWAEVSVSNDEKAKKKTAELESSIPATALKDYKLSRQRNLGVNMEAINLVNNGTLDYLILSQDDAKPQGIHVNDREALKAKVRSLNLTKKILVQPGADEISMLLLSKILSNKYKFAPKIKVFYSSEKMSNTVMPFDDQPLRVTVNFNIVAAGAVEVKEEANADLLFYVFASRFEAGRAKTFAKEIEEKVKQGKRVIVADIDTRGAIQGGDVAFSEEMLDRKLFPKLQGYASWNTAANTVGTALPQGIIFALAQAKILPSASKSVKNSVNMAQDWFTFHRVIDDFYFHTLVRGEARKYIKEQQWNVLDLGVERGKKIEEYCISRLQNHFDTLKKHYRNNKGFHPGFNPDEMVFTLPWRRIFEADILFNSVPSKK